MSTIDSKSPDPCPHCGESTAAPAVGAPSVCEHCQASTVVQTVVMHRPVGAEAGTKERTVVPRVEPGAMLAQRFEVIELIGKGGMGHVYKAWDSILGDTVALKMIRADRMDSDVEVLRLRREVQIARKVTHSNVCRLYDLIHHQDDDGLGFDLVSMEMLEGETLQAYCRRRGPLPVDEALAITRQIARGLHAAHHYGIVHRDLKPANIMLVPEARRLRAVITDFGLARQTTSNASQESITERGDVMGTPAYMAPEQITGDELSPATDIYSLGIVLYQMLTGKLPFQGDSNWAVMVQRLTEAPQPLTDHLPDLDPALLALVERCLEREAEARFESIGEILDALDFGDSSWDVYGRKADIDLPTENPQRISKLWVAAAGLPLLVVGAWWALSERSAGPGRSFDSPIQNPKTQEVVDAALSDMPRIIDPAARYPESGAEVSPPEGVAPGESLLLAQVDAQLAVFDTASSEQLLEDALATSPGAPRLLAALAQTRWRQGRELEAREAIDEALGRLDGLGRADQLWIEALDRGFHGDWLGARKTFQTLWTLEPQRLEVGLWIAEATDMAGQADPLPQVFDQLRVLPGNAGQDPRIDLLQGRLEGLAGNIDRREALVRQVLLKLGDAPPAGLHFQALRERFLIHYLKSENTEARGVIRTLQSLADALGTPWAQAESLRLEAYLHDRIGREAEALRELDQADALFADLGSISGRCAVHRVYGLLRVLRGPDRVERLERGLELCRDSGRGGHESMVRHHLARTWRNQGEFTRALTLFREAATQMEALDLHVNMAISRVSLVLLLGKMGRVDDGLEILESVEPWFRELENRERLSLFLLVSAELSMDAGRMRDAATLLDEIGTLELSGSRLLDYHLLRSLLAFERSDVDQLRRSTTTLLDLARSLEAEDWVAEARQYAIRDLLLEGRWDTWLERTAELGPKACDGWKAQVHLELDDHDAAARAIEALGEDARQSNSQPCIWMTEILSARLDARANPTDSIARLERVEGEALAQGHRSMALEAKLVRGHLQGSPALLRETRDEAEAAGLLRLAQATHPVASDNRP